MTKKKAKDLKLGDYIYFFNTYTFSVFESQVTGIEEDEFDFLKVTWENDPECCFPNYGYIKVEEDVFFPDFESDDFDYGESDGIIIYLNNEDAISCVEAEINRLKKEINNLS